MSKKTVYIALIVCIAGLVLVITSTNFSFKSNLGPVLTDEPIWFSNIGEQIISPPLVYNSQIFFQTVNALYAIDLHTQKLIWRSDALADELHIVPLVISDGIIIVQGKNGTVMAFSEETGGLLWENRLRVYHGTEAALSDAWIEDAEIYNGIVYIARYSTSLTAYDLHNGEIHWSADVPDRTILVILLDSKNVFLTTSKSIIQFDSESGRMLHQRVLSTLIHYAIKYDDVFYFAMSSDEGISVFALNARTLDEKWARPSKELSLSEFSGMIIDNDVLYISGDRLIAVSARNGQLLWSGELKSHYGPPVVSGEKVYIQDRANIYAYDKVLGVLIGRLPVYSDIPWTFRPNVKPTVVDGLLIVPSKGGHIYGYKLGD